MSPLVSEERVIGFRPLLRCCEPGFFFRLLLRFDLGGFLLHQLNEVVDDVGVFEAVVGEAADVDLVGAVAAAGEADIGFARFARAVDDAADDRDGLQFLSLAWLLKPGGHLRGRAQSR